jgi:sigma-B regulation protein RsbU (phosphoserine phosphatase)
MILWMIPLSRSPVPLEILASLRADIVPVAIGFLLCGLALGAGLLVAIRRRAGDATLISFAGFAAIYGLRALGDSYAFELLSGVPALPRELFLSALTYILPVPAILFFSELLGRGWRSFLRRLWPAQLVFAVIAIAFEIAVRKPEALMGPYRVLILFSLLVSLAHLFWPGQERTPDLQWLRGSFVVLVVFALLENLRAVGLVRWPEGAEPVGVLLFFAGLGVVTARRVFETEESLSAIRQELDTARRIQMSILPGELPQIEGLDLAVRYVPAADVAGDFYDFLPGDGRRLGVIVADVSGHGVPAALIASMVKVAVAAQEPHAASPARVLSGMNQIFHGKLKNQFITAVYIHLDLEAGRLTWASAGHPPPLLWRRRDGRVKELTQPGIVMGRLRRAVYTETSVPFGPGDRLLLFTDGIPEAASPAGEQLGDARLQELLAERAGSSAEAIAGNLIETVERWTGRSAGFEDDLTLVVAGVGESGQASQEAAMNARKR